MDSSESIGSVGEGIEEMMKVFGTFIGQALFFTPSVVLINTRWELF